MNPIREVIIGVIVLVLVGLGILWYMAAHPSDVPQHPTTAISPTEATGLLHITESTDLYTVDAQYPSSTPLLTTAGQAADASAVATMKSFEEDSVTEFHTSFTGLDPSNIARISQGGYKGSLTMEYKTYHSAHTVSYVYTVFADTLGAHPNTTYKTFTFDAKTGALLSLGNLFSTPDYLSTLSQISRKELPAMIAARENVAVSDVNMEMLNAGTSGDENNFQDFYLDGSNFVILFPPYAIGPYVLGSTELDIPLSKIPGMKAAYIG